VKYCYFSIENLQDEVVCIESLLFSISGDPHGFTLSVVLYIGIMKVRGFWSQFIIPLNQLDIYFLTVREYWLGIAKPKISSDQS